MKRKLTALIITLLLLTTIVPTAFPTTVHATNYTVSSGIVNLSNYSSGDSIIVSEDSTVTITGTGDVSVVCYAGVTLKLSNATINITTDYEPAIEFTGENSTLTLIGTNVVSSGYSAAGIQVGEDASLTINTLESGTAGSLDVTGGMAGAGIGGYANEVVGDITIKGGTIIASTVGAGSGIGTGMNGKLGRINITGGTITATGGTAAAGIGLGSDATSTSTSEINISGGTITAKGGSRAAGIGGNDKDSVDINISGGTVTATGGDGASGVGSGNVSASYNLLITGGTVFGCYGIYGAYNGRYDIGDDSSALVLSGDAKVFGNHNSFATPITDHLHFTTHTSSYISTYLGVDLPSGWSSAGYYLKGYTITYNDNGGTGGIKTAQTPEGVSYTIIDSSFSRESYTFSKWNTKANGSGTSYNPTDTVTLSSNLTLYAIWTAVTSTSLTLSSSSETLSTGETVTLTASILPTDTLTQTVTWQSSDTSVATVDTSGKITAVGSGTATITATNGTSSDTCSVTVTQPITSVNITDSTLDMTDGGTATLTCELLPSNAETETIYWTSSDTDVATVDTNGKVTATDIGTATITATAGGYSDTCDVTVSKKSVTSVTLNYSTNTLFIGEWFTLKTTVSPSDATYTTVTWQSSDTSVATVSAAGVVEAISDGTATITATADGVSGTCTVTVNYNSVTSVTLSDSSISMYLGDSDSLTATVLPTDAANPSVTWTSSDTSVATVSSGVVQAVGEGACTVTATADGVSDTCSVYVGRIAVTSVDLSYSSLSMYVDDQRVLTADISPSTATYTDVTWESSDTSIATVNSNGVVTAIKKGSATITATADGVSDSCAVTVKYDPEVEVSDVDFIVENSSVTVMYVGDTLQLTVAVTPSDATDTSVTWSSSDTEILTVTEYGLVTAKSAGDATITVTAQGNASATYKITVKTLGGDTEDDDSDGSSASVTAAPEVVIQSEETDIYLTFDLDVSNLGEDAKYIQLPNDEIIDIEGKDVISISILASDLDNGSLEIVTLDEDMVALGSVELAATDNENAFPWFIVLMLILGAVIASVGGTLLVVRLVVRNPSPTS